VVFLWLLSFAHAKESDSPVGETYSARAAENSRAAGPAITPYSKKAAPPGANKNSQWEKKQRSKKENRRAAGPAPKPPRQGLIKTLNGRQQPRPEGEQAPLESSPPAAR